MLPKCLEKSLSLPFFRVLWILFVPMRTYVKMWTYTLGVNLKFGDVLSININLTARTYHTVGLTSFTSVGGKDDQNRLADSMP